VDRRYVGTREATPILLAGLRRLEYRGYDSAGIAVCNGEQAIWCAARASWRLWKSCWPRKVQWVAYGIGHTRWATHGRPSDEKRSSAQGRPHLGGAQRDRREPRGAARAAHRLGSRFSSQTDTEVLAHLIDEALQAGAASLVEAVRAALRQVTGAYAIAVLSDRSPNVLVAAKNASPLVLGLGKGEMFIASDAPAILEQTRDMLFLEDGDIAELDHSGARITDLDGNPVVRKPRTVTWTAGQAEKAGYPHFMLKEIHEQPRAVTDTLAGRLLPDSNDAVLEDQEVTPLPSRVVILACGTRTTPAWWASSHREHRAHSLRGGSGQRVPLPGAGGGIEGSGVGISQSGETAEPWRPSKRHGREAPAPSPSATWSIRPSRAPRTWCCTHALGRDRRRVHQVLHGAARGADFAGPFTWADAMARSPAWRRPSWWPS